MEPKHSRSDLPPCPPAENQTGEPDFFEDLRSRVEAEDRGRRTRGNFPDLEPDWVRNRLNSIKESRRGYLPGCFLILFCGLAAAGDLMERLMHVGTLAAYGSGLLRIVLGVCLSLAAWGWFCKGLCAINVWRVRRAMKLAHRDIAAGRVPADLDPVERWFFRFLLLGGALLGGFGGLAIYADLFEELGWTGVIASSVSGLLVGFLGAFWFFSTNLTRSMMIDLRRRLAAYVPLTTEKPHQPLIWRQYRAMPLERILIPVKPAGRSAVESKPD